MTTHSTRSLRRLLLKTAYYADYTDQVCELEKALARKPEKFQIDIIGSGDLSPDTALLIRSVLLERSQRTHLITNARSSLQSGAALVWLLGDTRLIRGDAKLYLRRPAAIGADDDGECWKREGSKDPDVDLEEVDYAQVLQHIDSFLPVKELIGRALGLEVLRQFGLVDHQRIDSFLASAFARDAAGSEACGPAPGQIRDKPPPKVSRSDQSDKAQ